MSLLVFLLAFSSRLNDALAAFGSTGDSMVYCTSSFSPDHTSVQAVLS
jgi:hypothetical protein